MQETTVRITDLITDVDMRPTKSLVTGNHRVFGKLGRGQIALLVNRSCTIARFIDSQKTLHTIYAEKGQVFDMATIEAMVQKRTLAIGVRVVKNAKIKAKHVVGLSVERAERKKRRGRKAA